MLINGLYLTVLVGPTVPVPAPSLLVQSIDSVEVTYSDSQRSGFQISFSLGRSGQSQLLDYPLLTSQLLVPFNRIILVVTLGAQSSVLMDGVITHLQVQPSNQPGASKLQVTGEDVSVMMDLTDRKVAYDDMSDLEIVAAVIGNVDYNQYGLVPMISPLPTAAVAAPQDSAFQDGTDLAYLNVLAEQYGYVFYVMPGLVPGSPVPAVGTNTAYWGAQIRPGVAQPALSVNLGPTTNIDTISFQYNALTPETVSGSVVDRTTSQITPVAARAFDEPALSVAPALLTQRQVRNVWLGVSSGLTYTQALARAQGRVDSSTNNTIVAEGQLDTLRYGTLLQARRLVGVRGAGVTYDGNYYVQSVTHSLSPGRYKQSFTLLRQGVGAASPRVTP
jgi:hypothetical protein